MAFTQAYRFYDRFRNGQSVREPWGDIDPAKVPPGPKRPDYDFHGYVAALGDYPLLLRPLGLAIDLIMKRDPQIPDEGRVRVRADVPGELAWTTDEVARSVDELRDSRPAVHPPPAGTRGRARRRNTPARVDSALPLSTRSTSTGPR